MVKSKTKPLNFLLSNLALLAAEVTSPTVLARHNQRSHPAEGNCGQQLPLGCGSLGEDEDGAVPPPRATDKCHHTVAPRKRAATKLSPAVGDLKQIKDSFFLKV